MTTSVRGESCSLALDFMNATRGDPLLGDRTQALSRSLRRQLSQGLLARPRGAGLLRRARLRAPRGRRRGALGGRPGAFVRAGRRAHAGPKPPRSSSSAVPSWTTRRFRSQDDLRFALAKISRSFSETLSERPARRMTAPRSLETLRSCLARRCAARVRYVNARGGGLRAHARPLWLLCPQRKPLSCCRAL